MPPIYEVAVVQLALVGPNGVITEPEKVVLGPKAVSAPDDKSAIVEAVKDVKGLPESHRTKVLVRSFPG